MDSTQQDLFILELLSAALDPAREIRNEAIAKLEHLQSNPAFLCRLLDVAQAENSPVAKLAYISLKNAVEKLRVLAADAGHCSSDDPRVKDSNAILTQLKGKILQTITTSYISGTREIPKDFALLVRKIARWDYPLNWLQLHEALQTTLEACTNNTLHKHTTYNIVFLIYHIIKEKTSMRLLRDRNSTSKLAEGFYPAASRLWFKEWQNKYKYTATNIQDFFKNVDMLDLKVSLYLDSLLLKMYCNGLKNVYQDPSRLELLDYMIDKQNLLFELVKMEIYPNPLLVKYLKRLIFGFANLVEHEPMDFAFINLEKLLNGIFAHVATSKNGCIVNECLKLLANLVKSPVINNSRYSSCYYEHQGYNESASTSSPMRAAQKRAIAETFTWCRTFEEVKVHSDSLSNLQNEINSKKNSSPLRLVPGGPGQVYELVSKQATFIFCECLSKRGGPLQFIEFIRCNFLVLTPERINEWASDEFIPTQEPQSYLATELIDAMKISSLTGFNLIYNALVSFTGVATDAAKFESLLNLYNVTYPNLAGVHSYRHYIALLDTIKRAIECLDGVDAKLIIFRSSRLLNAWSRRINLFDQESKISVLRFLLDCVCCQGDSERALNLRAQFLVPLTRLYKETCDEPMWDQFFTNYGIEKIIHGLLATSKVAIPTIQYASLRLVCQICLEYNGSEENTSKYIAMIQSICTEGEYTLQVAEAMLQTSLSFLNSLHWQKCFINDAYINPFFLQFLTHLLFRTLVFTSGVEKTRSISRFSELEEETLSLWLCLLRLLPRNLARMDSQFMSNISSLFSPLLDFVGNIPSMDAHTVENSPLVLDLVTEYMSLVVDLTWLSQSSMGQGANVASFISNDGTKLIYRHPEIPSLSFNMSSLQALAYGCLRDGNSIDVTVCGLQLISLFLCGFSRVCLDFEGFILVLEEILLRFCQHLQEAATVTTPPSCNDKVDMVTFCNGPLDQNYTWQPRKIAPPLLNMLGLFLPILVRWGLDSLDVFNNSVCRIVKQGNFQPQVLLLSLVKASLQFRCNFHLQHSAIVCACMLISALGVESFPRLFIRRQRFNGDNGTNVLRRTASIDLTESYFGGSDCKLLPSLLLDVANATLANFEQSKSASQFYIANPSYKRDLANMSIPTSNRINLCLNISSTHARLEPHKIMGSTPLWVFMGSLGCAVWWLHYIVEHMSRVDVDLKIMFMSEASNRMKQLMTDVLN